MGTWLQKKVLFSNESLVFINKLKIGSFTLDCEVNTISKENN